MSFPAVSRHLARAFYGAASGSGAVAGFRWLHRYRVPILCYHSVVDAPLAPRVAAGGLHLPAAAFRAQVQYLTARYRVVSVQQAVAALAGEGEPIPPRSIALTLDDGYANNVRVAAPILREFGARATCFLATAYIDGDDLYWWDEVALAELAGASLDSRIVNDLGGATMPERRRRLDSAWMTVKGKRNKDGALRDMLRPARWSELRAAGDVLDFGGHSSDHRFLDSLSPAELADDLARCRGALATRCGVEGKPPFAYPAGRHTREVAAAVKAAGFSAALDARSRPREQRLASRQVDRWAVPRVGVTSGMNLHAFATALVGLPALLAGHLGSSEGSDA
jgi:peptidoglycan/xylan/chitin deacetylase (PgdA/CDA1 family)